MPEIPPPDPKVEYRLELMDRRFLRSLRISQDEPPHVDPNTLPLQSNPRKVVDDDDGA